VGQEIASGSRSIDSALVRGRGPVKSDEIPPAGCESLSGSADPRRQYPTAAQPTKHESADTHDTEYASEISFAGDRHVSPAER
jgi:hypothetical protein